MESSIVGTGYTISFEEGKVSYVNADDVRAFFYVINKMRWNVIEIRSCTIFRGFNQGFLVISRSMNVLVD